MKKKEKKLQDKNRYIASAEVAIPKGENYVRKIVYNFFIVLEKIMWRFICLKFLVDVVVFS